MIFRLPVSGRTTTVKPPTGREDVVVLEAASLDVRLGLALLRRLVELCDGANDFAELVITDYEALLLALHQRSFGNDITAVAQCGLKSCSTRMTVSFRIDDYLQHHKPRTPKGVVPLPESNAWYEWRETGLRYRLPTAGDLAEMISVVDAEQHLMRRCLDGQWPPSEQRNRLERFMAMQAPTLSSDLQGTCPDCGTETEFFWDVENFVLRELQDQAGFVYEDAHLLALHYHWPESQILDLPQSRRMQYAEMLREHA